MWIVLDSLIDLLDYLYMLMEVLIKECIRELGLVIDEVYVVGGLILRIEVGREELRKE